MKKSFISLAALALVFGLAGCGNEPAESSIGEESSEPVVTSEEGGETLDLPTEEGKITFYFTMAEESVALDEYLSVYFTGAYLNWSTDAGQAVEMQRLGETNVYYGLGAEIAGENNDGSNSYQMTLGYASASNAPTKGVNWDFKSDECAVYEFGTNPEYVVVDGKANLGTHTFSSKPGPIQTMSNITVKITLAAALPEGAALFIPNAITGWDTTSKMTPNEDRTEWSFLIAQEIVAGKYGCKILANREDTESLDWTKVVLDDGKGENYMLVLRKTAHDGKTYDINYECRTEDEITGEMINRVFDLSGWDWSFLSVEKKILRIVITAEAELHGTWGVAGTFNGWSKTDFTVNEAKTEFVLEVEADFPRDPEAKLPIEFGIINDASWQLCIKADNGKFKADPETGEPTDVPAYDNFAFTLDNVATVLSATVPANYVQIINGYVDGETAAEIGVPNAIFAVAPLVAE